MKKVIVWVCLLVILMTSIPTLAENNSFNEPFSIRNGIKFGMKRSQIQNYEPPEKLSAYNKIFTPIRDAWIGASSKIQVANVFGDGPEIPNVYHYDVDIYQANVAGQDCYVIYRFNESEELNALQYLCQYDFMSMNITDALQQKYGQPQYTVTKIPFDTTSALYLNACEIKYSGSDCKQQAYAGWLLTYSDIHVAIEATVFSIDEKVFYECITYTAIPDDVYTSVMNKTQMSISTDL